MIIKAVVSVLENSWCPLTFAVNPSEQYFGGIFWKLFGIIWNYLKFFGVY